MATVRQDVATLGAGWNKTLANYALAMQALDELPISDHNSWKFLGAMHGFDEGLWVSAKVLDRNEPIPPELVDKTFGDQCQHASWYFVSWHRGYLATFEAIVAAKVKELTGDDWALPYWNYLDTNNSKAFDIPSAFLDDTMPGNKPNPLKRYPRGRGVTALRPTRSAPVDLGAMEEDDFTVGQARTLGFGGGITGNFAHFGRGTGELESNPHNSVHGLIGGFMGNPLLAGLDPIFWLHHCNIDRLWEAWMNTPGKKMVRDPRWLGGPADRKFLMPPVGRGPGMTFTGRDTLPGGRLHPSYDDLTKGTGVTPGAVEVARVSMGPSEAQTVEPVGANSAVVTVGSKPARTEVALEPQATRAGVSTMGATEPGKEVTRFYLALESVKGNSPSPHLEVYVNLPEGADPQAHPELHAGGLVLFGLNVASRGDGTHAGNGLGYTLDITDLTTRLERAGAFDPERLHVTLVPAQDISDNDPITVDKISVLKRSGIVN